MLRLIALVLAGALATLPVQANDHRDKGQEAGDGPRWAVIKDSPHSVAETVTRFTQAVEAAGAKVFAVIDHAAGAESIGADLPPTTLVIFGNPKLGTPLMTANRLAAIDLPMKLLVWEEAGQVRLAYSRARSLKRRHRIEDRDEVFAKMKDALGKLTDKAIAP